MAKHPSVVLDPADDFETAFEKVIAEHAGDFPYRLYVGDGVGAWLEVGCPTGTIYGIFPVTPIGDGMFVRGDTARTGQAGVWWQPGRTRELTVVRRRAQRMVTA